MGILPPAVTASNYESSDSELSIIHHHRSTDDNHVVEIASIMATFCLKNGHVE